MEIASTVASLVTLIEVAKVVSKSLKRFCEAVGNAPAKILKIHNKVQSITTILEQIKSLCVGADVNEEFVPYDLREALVYSLNFCSKIARGLQSKGNRVQAQKLQTRLRWALMNKGEVEDILDQLRNAECELMLVLQVLHLRLALKAHNSLSTILNSQKLITKELLSIQSHIVQPTVSRMECDARRTNQCFAKLKPPSLCSIKHLHSNSSSYAGFKSISKVKGIDSSWEFWHSLSYGLVTHWNESQNIYSSSIRWDLPMIFGSKAFIFELTIRQHALSWANVSFLYGGLNLSNTVNCSARIWSACAEGNETAVRHLIESREASPCDRLDLCHNYVHHNRGSIKADQYETPLFSAIRSGNLGLTRYLLDVGADANAINDWHETPIHTAFRYASLSCDLKICELLVNRGASTEHVCYGGRTIFHEILYGFWGNGFWEYFGDQKQAIDKEIRYGLPSFEFLISNTNDRFRLRIADDLGQTPQHIAALRGLSKLFFFIIKHGADIGSDNLDDRRNIFLSAAQGGSLAIVSYLFSHGFDACINDRGYDGGTALHHAAANGRISVLKFLLCHDAHVNTKNNFGDCAIHKAVNLETIEALIEYGADVNSRNLRHETPLHRSARRGDVATVEILLRHKADANAKDICEANFLHYLMQYQEPSGQHLSDCLLTLIQHGADPLALAWRNGQCYRGTPFRWGSAYKAPESQAIYIQIISQIFPEISVDEENEVYWDAKETTVCSANASCFDSEIQSLQVLATRQKATNVVHKPGMVRKVRKGVFRRS